MRTVCLPTVEARELVGDLPVDVEVVIWDGASSPPAEISRVGFLARRGGPPPPAEVFAQLSSLEVIQLLAVGVDPWVGHVPEGVTFCNARGVHGGSAAELALTGMLALIRDLPRFAADQLAHRWTHEFTDCLDGKRVLVVGAGDIGTRIAAAVEIFGASATLVARTARERVRSIAEIHSLLPDHEVVAIALPGTPETVGLVDSTFLAEMPDGAILVNVGRGNVVSTDALLAELKIGRLGAFLDVVEPEPLPPDHPLWDAPNLIITSHVGGAASRWESRAYALVHEQILRWCSGQELQNVISGWY
jgi:phosphoglycerate dehydrogenase-like enzyme